jgi:hypothetical protein
MYNSLVIKQVLLQSQNTLVQQFQWVTKTRRPISLTFIAEPFKEKQLLHLGPKLLKKIVAIELEK